MENAIGTLTRLHATSREGQSVKRGEGSPVTNSVVRAKVAVVEVATERVAGAASSQAEGVARTWSRAAGRRLGDVLLGLVLPAALFQLWRVASAREWVSPLILPAPRLVWDTFVELYSDGTIKTDLIVSAVRILKGFSVGASIGLVLGGLLGASRSARAYANLTFFGLSQVNVIAWVPLFILVFGIDESLKTAIIAWSSALPVTITVMKGIADIPGRWFELARVQELRRSDLVRRLILPASVPVVFTGLRSGLASAWISLIVVELIASSEGIGFLVVWGRQLFQLDVVIVAIVIIGTIGYGLDLGLRLVEKRLQRWRLREQG